MPKGSGTQWATAWAPKASCGNVWLARKGKEPPTKQGWEEPRRMAPAQGGAHHLCHHGGARDTCVDHEGACVTRRGAHHTHYEGPCNAHVQHAERWKTWASRTWQHGEAGAVRPGQHVEGWGNWATCTRKRGEACGGQPERRGEWAAKTVKRPPQQPAQPPGCQLLGSANMGTTPQGTQAAAAVGKQ